MRKVFEPYINKNMVIFVGAQATVLFVVQFFDLSCDFLPMIFIPANKIYHKKCFFFIL